MKKLNICIIGGTGFVGTWLINALASEGHNIRVITRKPERHAHLKTIPTLKLIDIDFFASKVLERQLDNQDVVINLAGVLNPIGKNTFQRVHVEVPKRIVEATAAVGTPRLLHMSALNAAENGPSAYLRTKGEGQRIVHKAEGVAVTSFSPSVIFGPGDSFFNRFAGLLKTLPGPFPLTCPKARFAPIYIGDVVDAFINSIHNPATFGKNYTLCGPQQYTLRELVCYTAKLIGSDKTIIPLPGMFSWLTAAVMDWIPGAPITLDNYRSMLRDSVCDKPVAQELNLSLRSIEAVVPAYLASSSSIGQLDIYRQFAGR